LTAWRAEADALTFSQARVGRWITLATGPICPIRSQASANTTQVMRHRPRRSALRLGRCLEHRNGPRLEEHVQVLQQEVLEPFQLSRPMAGDIAGSFCTAGKRSAIHADALRPWRRPLPNPICTAWPMKSLNYSMNEWPSASAASNCAAAAAWPLEMLTGSSTKWHSMQSTKARKASMTLQQIQPQE